MRILLVNDDGYRAEGILTLYTELVSLGHEVTIFAPDRERSATSHAFTIIEPLRIKPIDIPGINGYMVNGTPADCARLGSYIMKGNVDFAISGINRGANTGGACVYSGTVGAAMEASMCGLPAMATSLCVEHRKGKREITYETTAKVTVKFLEWAVNHPLPMGEIYNLNVPLLTYDEIKGIRKATLAPLFLGTASYEKRVSPLGFDYYWLTDGENVPIIDPECDEMLYQDGWATVTPLTWDIAKKGEMDKLDIVL